VGRGREFLCGIPPAWSEEYRREFLPYDVTGSPPCTMTSYNTQVLGVGRGVPAWPADDCCDVECTLLTDVLGELRYLTARMHRDTATQKLCSEWKFAAMVVDRLCLWLFSVFTVVSSGAILLSAPDIRNIF